MSESSDFSLLVAYGSDMGSAEYVAMQFAEATTAIGIAAEEIELNQVALADLQTATHLVVVVSTFGDGEFPDNATLFWEELSAPGAARLEHLSFAVLALGDSGYELFCNAGRLLDDRLEALGATRLADRYEIDGHYEPESGTWIADTTKIIVALHNERPAASVTVNAETVAAPEKPAPDKSPWDRNNPYAATLAVNRLLSAPGADKEVRHFEIDLADSGISYAAGDSVAVHPVNDPRLVEALLAALGVGPDHAVDGHDLPLGTLLAEHLEIRIPSRALQALVGARTRDPAAAAALNADPEQQSAWLYGRDVLDLLELADLGVDEVVETLRPLQFRDYSISSSPLAHPGRVHLTVATVEYTRPTRRHGGVASTYLARRCDSVRVHLRPNTAFRLPAPDVPIIMVGPGTGIAPFRGFLQERQTLGAAGKSWLFFGDRRRATHYLYGEELEGFVDSGHLTRLDLAFSRDGNAGATKCYVQHRMREQAGELWSWLQDGAYFYVCGNADRMARDVDKTLHEVVATGGGLDADAAHAYVNQLIKDHRYVRDVY